jgi:hypothetical protein
MHTRLFLFVAGLGLLAGCGKDEHVAPLVGGGGSDAGDDTTSTNPVSPTTVSPTTSASVNPAVSPVNPGPATSKLAAACETNADCGSGLLCMTSGGAALFNGGAANGFCTADCSTDAAVCGAIQSGATCIGVSDTVAYCFAGCEPGGAPATKCQGRAEVACDYVTLTAPFCRPMCGTDSDCDGRKCDVGLGVCVDTLSGAGEIGAPCDPNATTTTECKSGTCVKGGTTGTANTGTCTGLCTIGTEGCSVEGAARGGDGWCAPFESGSNAGDIGVCSQICDCDGQCSNDSYRCLTFSEAAIDAFGVNGMCVEQDSDTTTLSDGFALGRVCEPSSDGGLDAGDAADGSFDAADAADGSPDSGDAAESSMTTPAEASSPDSGNGQVDAD